MGNVRLYGATSGYTELAPPAVAPDGVLTLPSGVGTLLKAEGGKVLQVSSTTKTNSFSTSSTSFVDVTGLSVSITPSLTTSKILVILKVSASKTDDNSMSLSLVRNSTAIPITAYGTGYPSRNMLDSMQYVAWGWTSIDYLDSPNTTSAITYKCQVNSSTGTAAQINIGRGGGTGVSSITVMEVSA